MYSVLVIILTSIMEDWFLFLQVTSDFEEDVKALPTDVNATQAYFDFIETYGTHYASVVVMGAKAVIQSQVLTK